MQTRFHFISLSLLLVPIVHAGGAKSPVPPAHGWQWKMSGGPTWQQIGELSFKGGTRSQSLTLPSFVGFDSLTVPPVGDDSTYSDREYNDGFVRQDGSTGFDGLTAYWGYENASQSQGGNLIYQATGWQSIRTDIPVTTRGRRAEDDLQSAGIELRADVLSPWTLGPFRVGGTVTLGFASDRQSIDFSNHDTTQIRDDYRLDYQDSYDLDGVTPPAPGYEGPSNGPGPLIPNIPTIRGETATDFSARAGPSSFEFDTAGYTIGLQLGIPF